MTDLELRSKQRDRLPSRDQINQINDVDALESMRDEVDMRIARIEADLDYRDATVEWENRAISALSVHRYISTAIKRRLEKLRKPAHPNKREKRTECLALTWMVIDGEFDNEDADTSEEIDAALKRLDEAMESIEWDRADETAKLLELRDVTWIVEANAAIKRIKAVRHNLSVKKAAILRAEKEARRLEMEGTRERMFIDACREVLPKETYQMLWNRVDRLVAEA